jgi:hypothetical protein
MQHHWYLADHEERKSKINLQDRSEIDFRNEKKKRSEVDHKKYHVD